MERMKKPCLGVTLLLFLFLVSVSAAHGARLAVADAKDVAAAAAAAAGDGKRVTVRTGHGHGYSSHSGGHPNGGTPEQGGAGVVDPRNQIARNHPRRSAASRALGYSSRLICTLVGVVMLLLI